MSALLSTDSAFRVPDVEELEPGLTTVAVLVETLRVTVDVALIVSVDLRRSRRLSVHSIDPTASLSLHTHVVVAASAVAVSKLTMASNIVARPGIFVVWFELEMSWHLSELVGVAVDQQLVSQ